MTTLSDGPNLFYLYPGHSSSREWVIGGPIEVDAVRECDYS